jgi:3-oxoacyl-[acyl-carrier protein] reductase
MIIITGASGGIGVSIVDKLSKLEKIIAVYNSSNSIVKNSNNVEWIKSDLRSISGVEKVINEVSKYSDQKISLLNMSAIKNDSLLVTHDLNLWDESISLNLTSPFYFAKLLIPLMIKNKWGRLMFVSSTGGMRGDIGTASYSASKMGLIGLSRVISKEYSKFNITSNVISLGTFDTGLFQDLSEEKRKEIIDMIPSKKLGDIENIINSVDFIIKSDYVNGSIINIDGGM